MVPLGPLFKQYNRTVREVTQALGKRVELVLEGQDVEVDTSIAELLRDPLMHMIRNAVDHGIELPEVRKRLGKPECGRILLRAYHDGGNIVVEVNDDGGGVRRARVVERARRLGLCAEPEKLGDDELLRLILRPGFSTSESVTNLSGRGVGMDVVSRNIESLRGSLQITSVEGTGTAFSVRLPLSLAMIDGFSVGVDSETYILPLSAVTECVELSARDSAKAPSGVFDLRGSPLPCARLRDIFGFSGGRARAAECGRRGASPETCVLGRRQTARRAESSHQAPRQDVSQCSRHRGVHHLRQWPRGFRFWTFPACSSGRRK